MALDRESRGRRFYQRHGKRWLDLTLTIPLLLLSAPLLSGVAVMVRLKLGAPVLFRQQRAGQDGKIFTLLKFRTMTNAVDDEGRPLPDVERLTRFGYVLRSTSLDELPELVNVLRGDMSLVGPRPLLARYLRRYTPDQMRRHDVKPGLTGWAQINGRNALSWPQRFALDRRYVERQSLRLDLSILCRTAWQVARRAHVSHEGHVTMGEFWGQDHRAEGGS
jgi:sugar transferase EpsL